MRDDLDTLLSRRAVPETPEGLSERIIAAALQSRRKKPTFADMIADLWRGFSDLFVLPQPAFALAVILLAGFVLGIGAKGHPSYAGGDEVMTSFGVADQDYEEGDFL